MPAPVIVFCYNRPEHLQSTVEQLKKCNLAQDSTVFFFSDGPKGQNDQNEVKQVRDYIRKVNGFKEIIIEISNENKGLANSVIEGVSKVISKFGSAIVLEDDILVSVDFLEFMNQALDYYFLDHRIYSISGYSYLLEKCNDANGLNLVRRASSWGWATWNNRWESVDWSSEILEKILKDKKLVTKLRTAGEDMPVMVKKQMLGVINSWAIRWTCQHLLNDAFCLVPRYSKVENIGTDGSGTNFTEVNNKFTSKIYESKIDIGIELFFNPKVSNFIKKTFNSSVYRKTLNYLSYGIW
ncbi:MAG: glycosyltransferase [Cytophagaceae bacterium]|nr:glycosyltransferase [Cytophagaceae bacterium]